MNIFIRTDASIEIGTGHVMRCLTLASILCERGARVSFICRELNGNLCSFIAKKGFRVYCLKKKSEIEEIEQITPHSHWLTVNWKTDAIESSNILKYQSDVDWLVLDHYALDKHWETKLRPYAKKMMVIDDLSDREHVCDILLDQNLIIENKDDHYETLVPVYCKKFLGPKYSLLRKEFNKGKRRNRDGSINRIMIFFGGSDFTNETKKAIEAYLLLNKPEIKVDVIVGKTNIFKKEIYRLCMNNNLTFRCQIENIAEIMSESDIAIGACGTVTWERLYLGLPAIVVSVADNQKRTAKTLSNMNVIKYLGTSNQVKKEKITLALKKLLDNPSELIEMSKSCIMLMGNQEVYRKRLTDEIFNEEGKSLT